MAAEMIESFCTIVSSFIKGAAVTPSANRKELHSADGKGASIKSAQSHVSLPLYWPATT